MFALYIYLLYIRLIYCQQQQQQQRRHNSKRYENILTLEISVIDTHSKNLRQNENRKLLISKLFEIPIGT